MAFGGYTNIKRADHGTLRGQKDPSAGKSFPRPPRLYALPDDVWDGYPTVVQKSKETFFAGDTGNWGAGGGRSSVA